MEILESIISLALAMLILSLMVEKITNFWKLHGDRILNLRKDNLEEEKIREREIHRATFITGLLVALLLKADAIQILRSPEPQQAIGWDLVLSDALPNDSTLDKSTTEYFNALRDPCPKSVLFLALAFITIIICLSLRTRRYEIKLGKLHIKAWITGTACLSMICAILSFCLANSKSQYWAYVSLFAGIILSGAGISFGSKFWHDLLDTLFQIRDLKKKLNSKELYKIENIRQLDEYLRLDESDVMKLCLDQHGERLLATGKVSCLAVDTALRDGRREKILRVYLITDISDGIEKELKVNLPSGAVIAVPVEFIKNAGETQVLSGPGSLISTSQNTGSLNSNGTFGCVLRRGSGPERYVLTCNHVLTGDSSDPGGLVTNKDLVEVLEAGVKKELGEWFLGYRNQLFDIALIEISPSHGTVNNIVKNVKLAKARPITTTDKNDKTSIELVGAISNSQVGRIVDVECAVPIKYDDGKVVTLQGLFAITQTDQNGVWKPISQKGDSGAVIFDTKNSQALGMLVAGNKQVSYAISMTSILDVLGMKIA